VLLYGPPEGAALLILRGGCLNVVLKTARRLTPYSQSLYRKAKSYAIGCALAVVALSIGCGGVSANNPPPCPTASEKAIRQIKDIEGTELEHYIGEMERYCDAIDRF
jgi:hypothetical protein